MIIKAKISFDENPVIDSVKKFVFDNLRDVGKDDFIANVARLAVSEVQKTLKIEFDKPNVIGE